jgi:hypothetical protein
MDTDISALASRVQETCGELGLSSAICQEILNKALRPAAEHLSEEMQRLRDQNAHLLQQIADLQSQRDRWQKMQREIIALVEAPSPDKIVHSLRNVLNELTLLRAMSDDSDTER